MIFLGDKRYQMERNLNNIAEKGKNHILMYVLDIVSYFVYTFFIDIFLFVDAQVCDLFYNLHNYDFLSADYKFEKKKPIPFIIKISKI